MTESHNEDVFDLQDFEFKTPKNIVHKDSTFTIISHPRPVAKHHYVLAPTLQKQLLVRELNRSHLSMVQKMTYLLNHELAKLAPQKKFRIGFPAGPSVYRLHMHAVSDDLDGKYMNSSENWNAVSTDFFVSANKVIANLEDWGRVLLPEEGALGGFLNQKAKCMHCDSSYEHYTDLREHINEHHNIERK